jgi:hypothetical protein
LTEDEYRALLRPVYEFCGRTAAVSGKADDPILQREPPHIKKIVAMRRAFLKIKEGWRTLVWSLSMI